MGRNCKYKTEEERAEANKRRQRAWREKTKEWRKQQYKVNAEYRKKIQDYYRERYQLENCFAHTTCTSNAKKLDKFGEVRNMYKFHKSKYLTLTIAELGEALGYERQTLYRWIKAKMLPKPIYFADVLTKAFGREDEISKQLVYTKDEAAEIIKVIGHHQKQYKQLRETHTEAISILHSEVKRVRSNY